ncbi:PREDICTED: mannose-binding protein C-like [Nanorana parkeri]|uniref:mannose-binding protein C-like n=1 Tax=Nanorana parkeri TaxID=125878 RepID=UPI0008547D69|nr:PREDICTED: mannose-binding protein C-like [Nanorana parkeri]
MLIVLAVFITMSHSETPAMCSVVQGLSGLNGRDGANGPKGDPGSRGVRGEPGIPGERGNLGPPGKVGPKGNPGEKGNAGVQGVDSAKTVAMENRIASLEKKLSWLQNVLLYHFGKEAGNKVFVTNGKKENFDKAQKTCREAGGNVAMPRNAAENSAVEKVVNIREGSNMAFLGISDSQLEGTFKYSTGETVNFTNWRSGEPNNSGDAEDCVEILGSGQWNDVPCSNQYLVICEFQST